MDHTQNVRAVFVVGVVVVVLCFKSASNTTKDRREVGKVGEGRGRQAAKRRKAKSPAERK